MTTYKTSHRLPKEMQDVVEMLAIDKDNLPMFFERVQTQLVDQAKTQRTPDLHIIVPAKNSQPAVDLYTYFPKNDVPNAFRPTIYFMHGGGYVVGVARQQADMLSEIATRNLVNIVTVEYRLATVAPFPADLNDAYHGLRYLFENAQQFKTDKDKVILMGDSAGGGLAARLALYNRDKGHVPVIGQILLYPMLDYRTGGSESLYNNPFAGEFSCTKQANQYAWQTLRGGQTITDQDMPYFSPALAKELSGLPPTFIAVGDLDLFVNESLDYANRLIMAGVEVQLSVLPNLPHGFEKIAPQLKQVQRYYDELANWLNDLMSR